MAVVAVALLQQPANAQDGYRRYQSAHCVALVPAAARPEWLLVELEKAYSAVQKYGLTPPPQVEVRCYASTYLFMQGSGGSPYTIAIAQGKFLHLQPMHVLQRRTETARALVHEMAHTALADAAAHGLPRWLNEGLAMVVAGEKHPERGKFGTLQQLEDTLQHARNYKNVRKGYGTAEFLVSGLINAYGKGKVLELVRNVAAGKDFRTFFRKLTGLEPETWGAEALKG